MMAKKGLSSGRNKKEFVGDATKWRCDKHKDTVSRRAAYGRERQQKIQTIGQP